jgi:hypothetical protein
VKGIFRVGVNIKFCFLPGLALWPGQLVWPFGKLYLKGGMCLNDSRIRDNSISCPLLSTVNKGAAINKPSIISLRKSTLLYVIWAREELFQGFRAGANQGCWGERKKGGQVK